MMNIKELIKIAFIALGTNKTRTALTMLGIIIGIASVIVMLGIGYGAQASVQSSITSLGSNILSITAGAQRNGLVQQSAGTAASLTNDDAKAIADPSKVQNVSAVSPEIQSNAQVIAGGTNTNTIVYGVTPAYLTVHNFQMQEGNFISTQNIDSLSRVAIIGPDTSTNLFGTSDPVGQTIKINKIRFTIIGMTVAKGSTGFSNSDDFIAIPLSTAQRIVFGIANLRSIVVQATSADTINQSQSDINTLLLTRHKIVDPTKTDFTIRNSATTLSTLSSATGVFTVLLASIASISLLVGGIGIMNIMIVTVTERTREIGLRKAIGAENRIILFQFLTEAITLTFLSGLIGIIIGIGVSLIISNFAGIKVATTAFSIILSTGVSLLVGIIFGLYPAYKASRLSPIEALRYE